MVKLKTTLAPFWILLFFTIILFVTKYNISINFIKEASERYLEESLYSYSLQKMDGKIEEMFIPGNKKERYANRLRYFREIGHIYNHYEDSVLFFEENEEWEYRTIFTKDGAISKNVKKKLHVLSSVLSYQSHLVQYNTIETDSIITIFKKTLFENKNIMINSPIYISVKTDLNDTIHFKNFENLSELKYNYTTPPIKTGYLDEITYVAYLNLNFKTVYSNMPKGFLTQLYILCIIALFYFLWRFTKDCYDKSHTEIVCLDPITHRYKLGHVLFIYEQQQLYYKKEIKMNYKTNMILLKLLESEDYTLSKKTITQLCTGGSNMTSHMNLVRTALKRSTCRYTVSNFKRTGYYRLELDKQPFVENKMDDLFRVWEEAKERLPEKIKRRIKL